MLDLAIKYQDQVISKFRDTWFKDKYKYFHNANFFEDCAIKDSTWNNHQFVSVRNGEVIGYIGYGIDRSWDLAHDLCIINFEDFHPWYLQQIWAMQSEIFLKNINSGNCAS